MSAARQSHLATLQRNGKVLVSGGYNGNNGSGPMASAEVFGAGRSGEDEDQAGEDGGEAGEDRSGHRSADQ